MKKKVILLMNLTSLLILSSSVNCTADFLDELRSLYRIDLLPQFEDNVNVRQVSSYDPTGGNDDGFSGKYSYIRKEDGNLVIADLKRAGVIQRIWTPTPTNDTIQFFFDGEPEPRISMRFMDLFSGDVYPFINPIVGSEAGGYFCYIPIPYQKSCKVVLKGSKIKFYQIQHKEVEEKNISSFPKQLSEDEQKALKKAANFWSKFGTDILALNMESAPKVRTLEKDVILKAGKTASIFKVKQPGRIIGFHMTPSTSLEGDYKDIILSATWDDEPVKAINSPVTDFFGYSFGTPAMQSLLMGVTENLHYCYLPMPFDKSAHMELKYIDHENTELEEVAFKVKVFYTEEKRRSDEGKLYAQWRREINPEEGKPYKLLKAKGRGHHVATILQTQGLKPGATFFFEGDDSTVVDGNLAIHGTGSEDYFNGGWYGLPDKWDQGVNLPVHGALTYSVPLARTGGYRFKISDKVPFEESYLQTIEHGPEGNKFPVDYTSVAIYYANQPPTQHIEFTPELIKIKPPEKLEYLTNLLPILSLRPGSSITHERILNEEDAKRYKVLRISSERDGFAKFELEVPSEGEYLLYMSFFKCPTCSTVEIKHRQNTVSSLSDTRRETNVLVEKKFIGVVDFKKRANTISVIVKKERTSTLPENEFVLHKIFMEKK